MKTDYQDSAQTIRKYRIARVEYFLEAEICGLREEGTSEPNWFEPRVYYPAKIGRPHRLAIQDRALSGARTFIQAVGNLKQWCRELNIGPMAELPSAN